MAAGQTPQRQPAAAQHAVAQDGLHGIGGTGGIKAAGGGQHRRYAALIDTYGQNAKAAQQHFHHTPPRAVARGNGPAPPKETPSHGPRRLGAARPVGRFRFNRMLRPPARAGLSAAAAAEIRRSRGKGPARHRRYAFSPQPPDRHGPAGGRSANGKTPAANA